MNESDDDLKTRSEAQKSTVAVAEPDELVENVSTGASVSVDISRGTGTRDQEKWSLKGKGRNAEEAIHELREQLAEVVGPLDERPLATQTRGFDPADGEDDE